MTTKTDKTGLFGLPAEARFEIDTNSADGLARVVVRIDPEAYGLDEVARCSCWMGDGPSDEEWAAKIAELLRDEHRGVASGLRDAISEARLLLDMPAMYRGQPNYTDADVVRSLIRHARDRAVTRA